MNNQSDLIVHAPSVVECPWCAGTAEVVGSDVTCECGIVVPITDPPQGRVTGRARDEVHARAA